MTKLCGIYLLTHIESGRKYVGQSINIQKRYSQHSSCGRKTLLANAIQKYGWSAFANEILELCHRDDLNELESKWIKIHNCIAPNGFNLTTGGGQAEVSAVTRAKISMSHKGKIFSENHKANIAKAKQNISAETRAKISFASRNRDPEINKRISETSKLRKPSNESISKMVATITGRKHSPETIEKMRLSQKGRTFTDESRIKMSISHTGKTQSEESRAKKSAATKGRPHTAEHTAKAKAARAAAMLLRNSASVAS